MARNVPVRVDERDWTARAVLSGFIATIAMGVVLIIGFVIATNAGSQSGNTFLQWLYGLAHNKITTVTQNYLFVACALYLAFGLIWALVYVRLFVPLLSGPGWLRGLIFAVIPFILSVVVFLPTLGGGFLGDSLNAGPLPFFGNLVLHLIYGLVLGAMYSVSNVLGEPSGEHAEDLRTEHLVLHSTSQKSALGMLSGIVVGAVLGMILGINVYPPSNAATHAELITGAGELSLAGAVLGAALGALVGSMFGLNAAQTHEP